MAKNVVPQRPKSGNGVPAPAPEQPESLDQVRDILFGGQMRMVDARLHSLEERIVLEQATLRADLGRRIAELEEASRKEFASHAERLTAERNKRAEDLKAGITKGRTSARRDASRPGTVSRDPTPPRGIPAR